MKYANGTLSVAVNQMYGQAQPGFTAEDIGVPVMTTPATIVTTPEDVALVTATLNATAAALNYANAAHRG